MPLDLQLWLSPVNFRIFIHMSNRQRATRLVSIIDPDLHKKVSLLLNSNRKVHLGLKEPCFYEPMTGDHKDHSNRETWPNVLVTFLTAETKDLTRCKPREKWYILVCISQSIMVGKMQLQEQKMGLSWSHDQRVDRKWGWAKNLHVLLPVNNFLQWQSTSSGLYHLSN